MKNLTTVLVLTVVFAITSLTSANAQFQREVKKIEKHVIITAFENDNLSNHLPSFCAYFDKDYYRFNLDKTSFGSIGTEATVYEVRDNEKMTLREMFTKIDANLNNSVMTQAQIYKFRKAHFDLLADSGYPTYFLTADSENELFVICIKTSTSGTSLFVYPIDFGFEYSEDFHYRVVYPN